MSLYTAFILDDTINKRCLSKLSQEFRCFKFDCPLQVLTIYPLYYDNIIYTKIDIKHNRHTNFIIKKGEYKILKCYSLNEWIQLCTTCIYDMNCKVPIDKYILKQFYRGNISTIDVLNAVVPVRNELKNNNNDELTPKKDTSCVICMNDTSDHLIYPCGHKCLCYLCTKEGLENCPICRSTVIDIIKVYD